jgi:hypothetical protein
VVVVLAVDVASMASRGGLDEKLGELGIDPGAFRDVARIRRFTPAC